MTKFIFTFLSITLFYILPIQGMDAPEDKDMASFKGLKKEHVLLALWVNASGTGNVTESGDSTTYLATVRLPLPTLGEASTYLSKTSKIDYFHGRKISGYFTSTDSYACYAYNNIHGPQRAQKVIAALRALPNITPQAITELYISVLHEVMTRDGARMNELVTQGKTEEAFKIHSCLNARKDADGTGLMLAANAAPGGDITTAQEIGFSLWGLCLGNRKAQADRTKVEPTTPLLQAPIPPSRNYANEFASIEADRERIRKQVLDEWFNGGKPSGN